jgi:hypothetical protein
MKRESADKCVRTEEIKGVEGEEKRKSKGAALFLGRPTEWARTVICESVPFDLAHMPVQRLCQEQNLTESPENASFFACFPNLNVH